MGHLFKCSHRLPSLLFPIKYSLGALSIDLFVLLLAAEYLSSNNSSISRLTHTSEGVSAWEERERESVNDEVHSHRGGECNFHFALCSLSLYLLVTARNGHNSRVVCTTTAPSTLPNWLIGKLIRPLTWLSHRWLLLMLLCAQINPPCSESVECTGSSTIKHTVQCS